MKYIKLNRSLSDRWKTHAVWEQHVNIVIWSAVSILLWQTSVC